MGLKKYEIITVGSDKRVRALRSWQVGDRYVNIGDVGGIVYDEKTLSQDGACWLFRGNFGFPGARIGGDSIVDVGEAALSAIGAPNVDILGSSVVVGSKLLFEAEKTAADIIVLTADDFEQGGYNYVKGAKWEDIRAYSPNYIRTKNPIFAGGASKILKCEVPGYSLNWFALDRDGIMIAAGATTTTGEGVTTTVDPCQYFLVRLTKNPVAATVPADATAAQITFTGTYETKLSIIDSRVEINPVTSTKISSIKPGGRVVNGSYPEAIIRNSKMSVNASAAAGATARIMGQIIGSTATLDATAGEAQLSGIYSNVKNLTVSGSLSVGLGSPVYNAIQATDCDNFATSPGVFPGYAAGISANTPFIFQGCNVPNGRFYHHAQIANTYRDINFDLATKDLGKTIASGQILASSEVEGMYRVYSASGSVFGALAEAHDSVKSLNISPRVVGSYGTTIYRDAYFNGLFDIAGTNVFGNKVRSHSLAQVLNVQPRVAQGSLTTVVGQAPSYVYDTNRVCTLTPFRLNTAKGLSVYVPSGLSARFIFVDARGLHTTATGWLTGTANIPAANVNEVAAYLVIQKDGGTTPEDSAGVTVTVYNGCKIVNTGETVVNMKGNIRVEGNATLTNCSITGTGYFGGNAVASGLLVNGCAYMKDNAKFVKTAGAGLIRNLKMTENAYAVLGDFSLNGRIHLSDNARFTPRSAELYEGDLIMKDNAAVSGNAAVIIGGVITMKDNARVSGGAVALSSYGDITLCGSYNQTANKVWTGKRVIDNENEPIYDNNVKTQYDF